jgi:GNAT superfamily N-acetyltransferase
VPVVVRPPRFADTPAVYRICFETGPHAGDPDATPELIGHVYAGPYLAHAPAWCRVVADERGPAGYLLAVPSTAAFEAWAEAEWWPALRAETPEHAGGLSPADRGVARLIARPTLSPPAVAAAFPAHLHIDFLERVRGQGFARRLIDDLVERLDDAGVHGVHLGASPDNTNAVGLYRHLGFRELERGDGVIWMGRAASPAASDSPR